MFLLTVFLTPRLLAQSPPASLLSQFIDANARFGRELLWHAHSSSPEKNIALAPLPVSLTFAALSNPLASDKYEVGTEINKVFGWSDFGGEEDTSRILVTLFQKPPKSPPSRLDKLIPPNSQDAWEGIWLTTQFRCACLNLLSQYFVKTAREDFGLAFENDSRRNRASAQGTTLSLPSPFRITSAIHLKSRWIENIFMHPVHKDTFTLESGRQEQVGMMPSDLTYFAYANTKDFEEVILPSGGVYMLVVLPAQGKTVAEIEEEIANATESPEAKLRYRLGSVDLPWFGFAENRDLTPALEEMGLRRAFGTPDAFSAMKKGRMGLALTDFSQASQIQVDPEGIRVDAVVGAEGMVGGILGGTLGPPPTHFHMVVNRPFLFFVRDNMTGSLVFEGAVMDPSPAN